MIKKVIATCEILKAQALTDMGLIEGMEYSECGYKVNDIPPDNGWLPYPDNNVIKGRDKHYWIKAKFSTPTVSNGQRVILKTSTGFENERDTINPQGMVFIDGKIVQALDTKHTSVDLEPEREYELYIYFFVGSVDIAFELNISLGIVDSAAEQIYYDIYVPLQACTDIYNENSYEYSATVRVLETACNILELNYPYTPEYYEKIEAAREYLKKNYYDAMCGNSTVTVDCIGHTHIDVAWLWTLAQTREKVQRSFSTMLNLMNKYPEYRFMMSQPQLLKFLSEVSPDIYAQIKELARNGRFETEGAMWVEADCNLSSGESLVRQIQHGKKFIKDEFGSDSRVLWLPDVFGYSAAIPQILKKSGIDHFITSKISWNDTNILPYDTFVWQGIDGSEILTDFITTQDYKRGGEFDNETTYVGMINPSMVAGTWNRYQQKEYSNNVMLVYGWGDGGGGPTRDMLEQQRRLCYGLPGLPKTNMSSLREHLDKSEADFEKACKEIGRTPKWVGELYLEFHRGTYTSMAANKRYNRKCEMMMQRLEGLASICHLIGGSEYLKKDIYDMWEVILLNQFHDIIPGSSIREVYEDSHKQYKRLMEDGNAAITDALDFISKNVVTNGGTLIYNSLGFARNDIINIGGRIYETGEIPAYGWKVVNCIESESRVKVDANGRQIENDYFVLTLDESGRISYIFDKRNIRSVLKKDLCANEIRIFEDIPLLYENWEISNYYKNKCKVLDEKAEISVIDEGQRKGFEIIKKYHGSTIKQQIFLYNTIDRIDVNNQIDWHERRQLVKIAFPFDIHFAKTAFDIQFGNVERTLNTNTSWEKAKFEVCGHKWVDVSEYGYGVSLLNDCKYGYSVDDNVLSLTAIKCGIYPNEEADQGFHEFSYSIYPHKGDFREGNTVKAAYSFNQPLEIRKAGKCNGNLPVSFSLVQTDSDNIIIETVKQCENGLGIILRLYDAYNCKSSPVMHFGIKPKCASICDLLENEISELEIDGNDIKLNVGNFEIITVKVIF